MNIRIDTPDSPNRPPVAKAEPLNDEQYIYAPFDEEDAPTAPMQDDIARGIREEEEYVEENYPENVTGCADTTTAGDASAPDDFANNDLGACTGEIPDDFEDAEPAAGEEIDSEPEEEMVSKEEYDALADRYNRLMSDWDNYRRRTAEDIELAKKNANMNMATAIIPTLDHFGFALQHAESMKEGNPGAAEMAKGFDAIYRALVDSLSREGLEVVNPAPGTPFDMNDHQAVETVPDTDIASDCVVRVIQTGYKFNGKSIRPALVAVAS